MDQFRDLTLFGYDIVTLGIWTGAGIVAGFLLMTRRPLGLIGDIAAGVAGGLIGGWASGRFGIDLASFVSGVDPSLARTIGDFLTALIGALVVLLVLRVLIRRR